MEQDTSFGYWLRQRRKAVNLTQEELARRIESATETIRSIEAGILQPSRQMAERIAACLLLHPDERVSFLRAAQAQFSSDSELIAAMTEMSEAPHAPLAISPINAPLTFLFTDIVGSTRRWEQRPEMMRAELIRHDVLIRMAIEAHCGYVFKTVGDASYAAFISAQDALNAALMAQRALQSEDWGIGGPLLVRMALHTGAAELHNGDYIGLALIQVARLLTAGHGGQILLSRTTTELLRDQLPADVELRNLGVHRLKNLTRPEQIAQVVAHDLPSDFPPLRDVVAPPGNLPAQLNTLIGREHAVVTVRNMLQHDDVRLVTLTGPGGTGKTRLALHVAHEVRDSFVDGAWVVNLASIHDPALVIPTIAQTLGVKESCGQSLAASLSAAVQEKQLLLLLDNFEQVLDAAEPVAALLAAAPKLKILITSRILLHLSGEHIFAVPPLALPERQRITDLAQLTQSAAVRLFIARARAMRADFTLTEANAWAVSAICQRLDGLPLAIELAAARVRLFSPEELLARLDSPLNLLTGGSRDLPERQQTLRNTIDWSYNLLHASEQALFRRLSVFVGGCTLAAVTMALHAGSRDSGSDNSELETVDGLTALLDHHLLQRIEGATGEPRFRMLATLREYALERLELSGESAALHRQHAMYFLELAEAAEKERGTWLNKLDMEQDNLRAALTWLLEKQEVELALRLSGALAWFWYERGYWGEGRGWFERAFAQARGAKRTQALATALHNMAFFVINQNDYIAGQALLAEGLELCRELGDREGSAWALHHLGVLAREQGNAAQARILFEEMLAIFQELQDTEGVAWALCSLGAVAVLQEDAARATELLMESHTLFQKLGVKGGVAWTLNHLGHVAQLQGDYERALRLHEESLPLFESGTQLGAAWALQSLGEVALAQHDAARAQTQFTASLALFQKLGNKIGVAWCLAGMAGVASVTGQPQRAARLWGAAEAVCATVGGRPAPGARASYDQAETRAQLDDATFATAWAAGQALSLEQAIEAALEGTLADSSGA